jgi:hypothetical protein
MTQDEMFKMEIAASIKRYQAGEFKTEKEAIADLDRIRAKFDVPRFTEAEEAAQA